MGIVLVTALIENLTTSSGRRRISAQTSVAEIHDARLIPRRHTSRCQASDRTTGLNKIKTVEAKTVSGPIRFGIYDLVKLTIQGRDCEVRVSEVADSCPVLIGYIPLELLDFVVSPKAQKLIGNPDHGGQYMIDMY